MKREGKKLNGHLHDRSRGAYSSSSASCSRRLPSSQAKKTIQYINFHIIRAKKEGMKESESGEPPFLLLLLLLTPLCRARISFGPSSALFFLAALSNQRNNIPRKGLSLSSWRRRTRKLTSSLLALSFLCELPRASVPFPSPALPSSDPLLAFLLLFPARRERLRLSLYISKNIIRWCKSEEEKEEKQRKDVRPAQRPLRFTFRRAATSFPSSSSSFSMSCPPFDRASAPHCHC